MLKKIRPKLHGVIEVVNFKFKVRRIALHDTTLTAHDPLRQLLSKVHDPTQQEKTSRQKSQKAKATTKTLPD